MSYIGPPTEDLVLSSQYGATLPIILLRSALTGVQSTGTPESSFPFLLSWFVEPMRHGSPMLLIPYVDAPTRKPGEPLHRKTSRSLSRTT